MYKSLRMRLALWTAVVGAAAATGVAAPSALATPVATSTQQVAVRTAPASATIAARPPMGWNSWNSFACAPSESLVRSMADAIVSSGMKAAGYRYVVIDDCWFDPQRTATGE